MLNQKMKIRRFIKVEKYLERLKKLRTEAGLTQKQVAEIINVSPSTVSKYESGKSPIRVNEVLALARFYDVSVDYIGGFTDKKGYFLGRDKA